MWILPKQLHTSAFVPDTAALSLDLNESSQLCAQSLFVRSKPSPARTWLLKWKRDSWTQHLSGRILKPSHGKAFETAWTSSLAATPASHSAAPESASEQKTNDIFGPTSQAEFVFSSPESASSRTLRATSASDCEKSVQTWKALVTTQRGEYSQRLNAVRLTSEEESFSLPTPCANEDSFRLGGNTQQSRTLEAQARRGELGEAGPLNPQFVEMMMGLPEGWTGCASSATESCQQRQN